ncbi:RNA recognition motif-containing protein, partial [Coemansia sp. RSA 2599]
MLFVRGIPKNATNEELGEFFSDIGPIRSCFVVTEKAEPAAASSIADSQNADGEGKAVAAVKPESTNKAPAKNRGFGFVQFVLAEDAARAIKELAEVKFRDEKRLMLDFAMKKQAAGLENADKKTLIKRTRTRTDGDGEDKSSGADRKPKKAKKATAGVEVATRTILIKGIPAGVTKQQLVKKVKKCGKPHSVVYPLPVSGAAAEQPVDGAGGSAHVTFEDHSTARKAVKSLHDHTYKGAKLDVSLKTESVNKNARLIVRNLPFKVRERELERLFSKTGTVLAVDLPRKYTGGPLRGFAFIQMGDVECSERAIAELNGHELQGRKIGVSFALAKDRFKELEEKGEIEKQEFEESPSKAESD